MPTGVELVNALSNELIVTVTIGDFVMNEDVGEKVEQSIILNIHPDIIAKNPAAKIQMIEWVVGEIMSNLEEEIDSDGPTEILSDHI